MNNPVQPPLTADDDNWHDHSAHWWETETAWWSFNIPERKIGGWLYTQVLAVQGVCNGGAWVWDDSEAGTRYERNRKGLPFPDRGDLRNIELPNGVSIQMLEPLMQYRTTYSDPGAFECDLLHTGIIAPHSHPVGAWPFWATRHFDQPMHVTGSIVLHGESIPVDCYSLRDRSWGPRPAGPTPPDKKVVLPRPNKPERANYPHSVGYSFATSDARNGFVAFTNPWIDKNAKASDNLETGYLLRDGVYAPLIAGYRTTELAPRTRFIRRIRLQATDLLGRELIADGQLVARHGTSGPEGTALFEWTWNDGHGDALVGFGEDQSFGPHEWFEALDGLGR